MLKFLNLEISTYEVLQRQYSSFSCTFTFLSLNPQFTVMDNHCSYSWRLTTVNVFFNTYLRYCDLALLLVSQLIYTPSHIFCSVSLILLLVLSNLHAFTEYHGLLYSVQTSPSLCKGIYKFFPKGPPHSVLLFTYIFPAFSVYSRIVGMRH